MTERGSNNRGMAENRRRGHGCAFSPFIFAVVALDTISDEFGGGRQRELLFADELV